jgi:DNA repair protein RecO (recombination protein O)
LMDGQAYVLSAESGLRAAHGDDGHALETTQWRSLQAALDERDALVATLRACAGCQHNLQVQLRALLHYHSGVRVFRTRQLMLDIQSMVRPRVTGGSETPSGSTPS